MIRKLQTGEEACAGEMMGMLWPGHPREDLKMEAAAILQSAEAAIFVAEEQGDMTGFAHCSLRHEYVEGAQSSPVGYLEGVYVKAPFRRRGIGRALVARCCAWARERGCREFASDCEMDNRDSYRFHRALGFQEANRVICFVRKLMDD